uniref:Uncharacterized protein n=1 Tax=Mycena chlorophos TaxID=658473 RepID=A0ABQ0L0Q5_MYCCL|nr:predicted protein [Mycena chlorophos]
MQFTLFILDCAFAAQNTEKKVEFRSGDDGVSAKFANEEGTDVWAGAQPARRLRMTTFGRIYPEARARRQPAVKSVRWIHGAVDVDALDAACVEREEGLRNARPGHGGKREAAFGTPKAVKKKLESARPSLATAQWNDMLEVGGGRRRSATGCWPDEDVSSLPTANCEHSVPSGHRGTYSSSTQTVVFAAWANHTDDVPGRPPAPPGAPDPATRTDGIVVRSFTALLVSPPPYPGVLPVHIARPAPHPRTPASQQCRSIALTGPGPLDADLRAWRDESLSVECPLVALALALPRAFRIPRTSAPDTPSSSLATCNPCDSTCAFWDGAFVIVPDLLRTGVATRSRSALRSCPVGRRRRPGHCCPRHTRQRHPPEVTIPTTAPSPGATKPVSSSRPSATAVLHLPTPTSNPATRSTFRKTAVAT